MRPRVLFFLFTLVVAATLGALAERLEDTLYVPPDHPAIQYAKQPSDPVNLLNRKLDAGQIKLDYAPNAGGYLASVLKQLNINADSQVLVFSRGSIQTNRISPRTPRALYFNDEVTVGYVQNGDVLELTSLDPTRGIYMYTLDTAKEDKPRFGRRDDCLRCHQGPQTLGVPGLMVSSVHPDTGTREGHGGAFMTDGTTPIAQRWGGWYVTGSTGSQTHFGNHTSLVDPLHPGPLGDAAPNLASLTELFDTSKYLVPTSDLIALITLEHQTRMTNLLTRIGWDARIALHDDKWDSKTMDSEIEDLVTYMLFADEAPLKEPVAGVSMFTKSFATRGPRDKQGRSLRDFDLKTRLFRYPVSYMIYSAAFDNLPDRARNQIYQRLNDVLSGKDQSQKFAKLPMPDRTAALAILQETKPNFPRP